jgi:hypothetical protein
MCNCEKNSNVFLSEGISINRLIEAMTNPEKRFEFPMKPITTEIDLSKGTKTAIIAAAAILATGLIILATRKNKK